MASLLLPFFSPFLFSIFVSRPFLVLPPRPLSSCSLSCSFFPPLLRFLLPSYSPFFVPSAPSLFSPSFYPPHLFSFTFSTLHPHPFPSAFNLSSSFLSSLFPPHSHPPFLSPPSSFVPSPSPSIPPSSFAPIPLPFLSPSHTLFTHKSHG